MSATTIPSPTSPGLLYLSQSHLWNQIVGKNLKMGFKGKAIMTLLQCISISTLGGLSHIFIKLVSQLAA